MGPFSGTCCEYKCQPESILAVAINSYSVSEILSNEDDHITESNNCELGLKFWEGNSKTRGSSFGGKHLESSQTINSTDPFTVSGVFVKDTRCLKAALSSKYLMRIINTGSSIS